MTAHRSRGPRDSFNDVILAGVSAVAAQSASSGIEDREQDKAREQTKDDV